ncbi:MAG: zinc ribbon domain-containing protein [Bacteroidetes bacterium]|nr:zinc ribbon domain-containing protein [Bacteroidota bacterium]
MTVVNQCTNCGETLPEQAKFCPDCGEAVLPEGDPCSTCGTINPKDAQSCMHCGTTFVESPPVADVFEPPSTEEIEQMLADAFMRELERNVVDQQDRRLVDQYFQRFHESSFRNDLEKRLEQMAEPLARDSVSELPPETIFDIGDLVDFFLIQHCSDLNVVYLPEKMLKYSGIDGNQTDLYRMALDYLAFDHEDVRIYTDFLAMPERTLKQASRSFLFADRNEKLWFICDQTMIGSGKAGFAMTNHSLFWKAPMEPPHVFRYGHSLTVEFEENWINLNGAFFDAGKSLNVRMSKLLRRLQSIF